MRSTEEIDRRSRLALETPLLRFLGATIVDGDEGTIALSIPLNDSALNAVGALHGGVIATALDVAAYLAVVPHLAPEEEAITVAFAASYLAGPKPDDSLRAAGSFLRRSRRVAFLTAELRSEEAVLAVANVTKAIRSAS
jgi:uncharacterized protein (TIGR00369 family)